MEKKKDDGESTGFRVSDKRHFTKEGDSLSSPGEPAPEPEGKEEAPPATEEPAAETPPEKDGGHQPEDTGGPGPPVDITHLVMSLVSSAFLALGVPDPVTKQKSEVNLQAASQMIDLLKVLQEKTSGNLTGPEEQIMQSALSDLRQLYVQASNFTK